MQNRNRLTDTENKLTVTKGDRAEVGTNQGVGLTDTKYYIQNRETTGTYRTAQEAIPIIL